MATGYIFINNLLNTFAFPVLQAKLETGFLDGPTTMERSSDDVATFASLYFHRIVTATEHGHLSRIRCSWQ
jgi:hypothetical protein